MSTPEIKLCLFLCMPALGTRGGYNSDGNILVVGGAGLGWR